MDEIRWITNEWTDRQTNRQLNGQSYEFTIHNTICTYDIVLYTFSDHTRYLITNRELVHIRI